MSANPADAVTDEELSGQPEADADAPDAEGGGESSVTDFLLSTEPDESPADYPEQEDYVSHVVIGVKKVLNKAMGGKMDRGTPAIQNFAMGAIGFATTASDDEGDDEQGGEAADVGHDAV